MSTCPGTFVSPSVSLQPLLTPRQARRSWFFFSSFVLMNCRQFHNLIQFKLHQLIFILFKVTLPPQKRNECLKWGNVEMIMPIFFDVWTSADAKLPQKFKIWSWQFDLQKYFVPFEIFFWIWWRFTKYMEASPQNPSRHSECLNILCVRTFQFHRCLLVLNGPAILWIQVVVNQQA